MQGMQACIELFLQCIIHQPMPLDAREAGKTLRNHLNAIMRFAFRLCAGMTLVLAGIVQNLQRDRLEMSRKNLPNAGCALHEKKMKPYKAGVNPYMIY